MTNDDANISDSNSYHSKKKKKNSALDFMHQLTINVRSYFSSIFFLDLKIISASLELRKYRWNQVEGQWLLVRFPL